MMLECGKEVLDGDSMPWSAKRVGRRAIVKPYSAGMVFVYSPKRYVVFDGASRCFYVRANSKQDAIDAVMSWVGDGTKPRQAPPVKPGGKPKTAHQRVLEIPKTVAESLTVHPGEDRTGVFAHRKK